MRIRQLNAEQHVFRMEKLYQRGATSIELLEQARTDADAAKAVTQRLQVQVNSLTLFKPG